MSKIYLSSDHAAFDEKQEVKILLESKGLEVCDLGPSSNKRCNYPDFASAVAKSVSKESSRGVILCGSGIGVSMVANRYQGVRAALCRTAEDAKLSRAHNDSNILCLGARISSMIDLKEMINTWLETSFEGGRHTDRIALFDRIGEKI